MRGLNSQYEQPGRNVTPDKKSSFQYIFVFAIVFPFLCSLLEVDPLLYAQIENPPSIFTTRKQYKELVLPAGEDSFQFAIYGDRTGGVPEGLKILDQAVKDTNTIGPDLVMTVGDLIQGYNRTPLWLKQKDEFHTIMDKLKCRWFPVAGNHDVYWDRSDKKKPAGHHEGNYEKHFGPLWYSFQHKNSGFLVLYTDEGDEAKNEKGFNQGRLQTMSPKQLDFVRKALKEMKDCNHVMVFLHHPRWIGGGYTGGNWEKVHNILKDAGNVSAVFAGHIHHMRYDGKRDGIEYFALATTGGHLGKKFPQAGYLHHFNLVTVRPDRIQVSTLPVGTVIDPKTFTQKYLGMIRNAESLVPVRVGKRISLQENGSASGIYEVQYTNPSKEFPMDVSIDADIPPRWQVYPAHRHFRLEKGQTVRVKFQFIRNVKNGLLATDPMGNDFQIPSLVAQPRLLLNEVAVQLPKVRHSLELSVPSSVKLDDAEKCLIIPNAKANVAQGIPVPSSQINLPQGPFTLEAWVNPSNNQRSRGIVAKTQNSEYALFSHSGRPSFDVNIDGKYRVARAKNRLPLNQWTHVAGVFDGKKVHLYLNGKHSASQDAAGKRVVNSLPLIIGADPDGRGHAVRSFAGKLDEVRLSKGVVYSNNFQPAQRLQKTENTILHFRMNGKVGPFLLDSSAGNLIRPIGKVKLIERN